MSISKGGSGASSRVSMIPSSVKKTIENIKEITGQSHSEDEIYVMLKECSMDPNETAQKLLLLDTFHEVKRKRDRRKENLNKEPAEVKWKPGNQGRPNRGGRGNYSSRYIPHDAGGGRNLSAASSHLPEKSAGKVPLATSQEMRKNETSSVASPVTAVSNGPSGITSQSTNVIHRSTASVVGGTNQSKTSIDAIANLHVPPTKDIQQNQKLELSSATSIPSAPASGSVLSLSDPVLLPSQDLPLPSAVGTIRREVGTQRVAAKTVDNNPTENKSPYAKTSTLEVGITNFQEKMPNDSQGIGKNQQLESMHTSSSTVGAPTVNSRPSSNYNNRSQVISQQKVGPAKEWKPKSTNPNMGQGASTGASSEVSSVSFGTHTELQTAPVVLTSKEATLELQKKLEEVHISDSQHVIIPNHLHVPEIEKLGFRFGSFDVSFGLDMNQNDAPGSDGSPLLSESSEAIDEPVKELSSSDQNMSAAEEDTEIKYPDHPQSPSRGPENYSSSEVEVPSSINPDYLESKPDVSPGNHEHPVSHTSSNYNFGFMPPVLSGQQLTSSETAESQARDAPRLPGFVVPQSFDPASYYAQFYRSGLENDGRISPFQSAGVANKYNGNPVLVSAQTSQELQGGVPLVLSTASPTPLVTQAAGVMQSSIAASQQPLPVFRQPPGVHLPHYPPNYIPYGPYFSPFYIPPIHQFLSNGAIPQQPQAGNLYPTAPGTNGKYSVSQFKQGSNTGSSTHIGVPGGYGPYGFSMANYNSSSATAAVTSTSNEDSTAPQLKENNVYVTGQQNEGSGVWFTTPSRDISTLQANSFYNLPQGQGQLAFTPTQPGHGTFTGIFHPATATNVHHHPLLQQPIPITNPVDLGGQTAGVYQQPQHAHNWPNNY